MYIFITINHNALTTATSIRPYIHKSAITDKLKIMSFDVEISKTNKQAKIIIY